MGDIANLLDVKTPFFICNRNSQKDHHEKYGIEAANNVAKNSSTGKSMDLKVSQGFEVLQLHSLSGIQ